MTAEVARTVDAVTWLSQNEAERAQVQSASEAISRRCADLLAHAGPSSSVHQRLADHFWCDVVAALVATLTVIPDAQEEQNWLAEGHFGDVTAATIRRVRNSRQTSTGLRSDGRAKGRPHRADADQAAGLTEVIIEAAISDVVRDALTLLTAGLKAAMDPLVLKLRITAILLCPDPGAHKLVWDECFVPLLGGPVSSDLQQQLIHLLPRFRRPL